MTLLVWRTQISHTIDGDELEVAREAVEIWGKDHSQSCGFDTQLL